MTEVEDILEITVQARAKRNSQDGFCFYENKALFVAGAGNLVGQKLRVEVVKILPRAILTKPVAEA